MKLLKNAAIFRGLLWWPGRSRQRHEISIMRRRYSTLSTSCNTTDSSTVVFIQLHTPRGIGKVGAQGDPLRPLAPNLAPFRVLIEDDYTYIQHILSCCCWFP